LPAQIKLGLRQIEGASAVPVTAIPNPLRFAPGYDSRPDQRPQSFNYSGRHEKSGYIYGGRHGFMPIPRLSLNVRGKRGTLYGVLAPIEN
jgi:hypothetical protein